MADLQIRILETLESRGDIRSTLSTFPEVNSQDVLSALNSLTANSKVTYNKLETQEYELTKEGSQITKEGSHEWRLVQLISEFENNFKISDALERLGSDGKLAQGRAFRNGWIVKGADNTLTLKDSITPSELKDETREQLLMIAERKWDSLTAAQITDLKKRKLIIPKKIIDYSVKRGPDFSLDLSKPETDITAEMVSTGKYRDLKFKSYNFNSQGIMPQSGALHPLMKVRQEFRDIFFAMGFREMPSNQYVETGFWNFDALYVPQQHPARDLQDTFYIKDPQRSDLPADKIYMDNVKHVHEDGKYDSIGYRYEWKSEESQKLVLRTHTTATSAAMLHELARDPKPTRLFSIDRVFRNEAVDATHLAEFHQVEGVLADYNITLGDLIKFMEEFFAKMGVTGLRFKPTYNPYTEPSMEIYSWHEGLGKWVEIGNSGMFRPEMLLPMGLPEDLRVLGWGLSLERPTMIKYGVQNIRELLGHKVSLDFIESNPAARLDEDLY